MKYVNKIQEFSVIRLWRASRLIAGFTLVTALSLASCGGGGGGSEPSSPAAQTPSGPSSADLVGNLKITANNPRTGASESRLTFTTKSTSKTSDGTDIYSGTSDFLGRPAYGAWYPSLSKYVAAYFLAASNLGGMYYTYEFTLEPDGSLTGCQIATIGSRIITGDQVPLRSNEPCWEIIPAQSHKYPAGVWARGQLRLGPGLTVN